MFDGLRNLHLHVNGVQHHGHRGYPAPGAGNTGCTMWEKARGARAPVMRLASERYDRACGETRSFFGADTGTEPEGRSRWQNPSLSSGPSRLTPYRPTGPEAPSMTANPLKGR